MMSIVGLTLDYCRLDLVICMRLTPFIFSSQVNLTIYCVQKLIKPNQMTCRSGRSLSSLRVASVILSSANEASHG